MKQTAFEESRAAAPGRPKQGLPLLEGWSRYSASGVTT